MKVSWVSSVALILLTLSASQGRMRAADTLRVDAISPPSGVTTPGIQVLIFGNGFSPDAAVYFSGLLARKTKFVSPSRLEAVTPYLGPGVHYVQVKSGGQVSRSTVAFTALTTPVDSKIAETLSLAKRGETGSAMNLLKQLFKTTNDPQVRAYLHDVKGQLYFAQGDWWNWGGETAAVYDQANPAGMTVQTYWRYGLAFARAHYLLHSDGDPSDDFLYFDAIFKWDVTGNPEPHFYRALLAARSGDMTTATLDADYCLQAKPSDPAYLALSALVDAASGDRAAAAELSARSREALSPLAPDARTRRILGETAYMLGDSETAKVDWTAAAEADPFAPRVACLAGRKHLWRGDERAADVLLSECVAAAPASPEAQEARGLLQGMQ